MTERILWYPVGLRHGYIFIEIWKLAKRVLPVFQLLIFNSDQQFIMYILLFIHPTI